MTSQWYICFQYQCHESLPTDDALLKRKWIVARISLYYTKWFVWYYSKIGKAWTNLCGIANYFVLYLGISATVYTLFPFITVCVVARGLRFDYEWALYMLYLCTLNLNMYTVCTSTMYFFKLGDVQILDPKVLVFMNICGFMRISAGIHEHIVDS